MAEGEAGKYPPFSLTSSRFDQSTYWGRYQRCLNVIDPQTLFVSEEKLQRSIKLLDDVKAGASPTGVSDKELWEARKIKEAIIHPDTGHKIFMPFRMSGYVPFGTITIVGLLLPAPGLKTVIFWQWLNQSHNAAVNYSNRNASQATPTSRFLLGYLGAVTSAVSIAVGLSVLVKKVRFSSLATRAFVQRLVAYPATATANVCNIVLMRNNELFSGIDVRDKDYNTIGTSKVAARKAIFETALTRIVLPAPVLVLPPIIMAVLERTKFLRTKPRWTLPVQSAVCVGSFFFALPLAIAMFPQETQIAASDLEPEIQAKTKENVLYFNKGL